MKEQGCAEQGCGSCLSPVHDSPAHSYLTVLLAQVELRQGPGDPSSVGAGLSPQPTTHKCVVFMRVYCWKLLGLSLLREREPEGKIRKDQTLGQIAICHPMHREIFPEKNGHIVVQELLMKNDMKNRPSPAITSSDGQLLSNINTNTFPPVQHLLI